jgi:signal transduction histidine kinase
MEDTSEIIGKELAILAHEIREPLASILFAVDCMNDARYDEFVCRQMCEIVQRQALHLVGIVNDILDASQATREKLRLCKRLIDLASVIETALETNGPMLTKRKLRSSISLPRDRLLLMADPLRVQQVVNNLVNNACKYTEPGGSISVSAEGEGDSARIEVRDTGVGIPPEMLPRVFDFFHRGGQKEHSRFSGLGIGLALVKSLVELHGGTVTAHSEGTGAGSTFVVRLPGVTDVSRLDPSPLGHSLKPSFAFR